MCIFVWRGVHFSVENGVLRTPKMSFDSVYDWNYDVAVIHYRDFLNVSTTGVPVVHF